ncbi:exostosin family protein [Zostera marina]|uniref:Exostosin family protein n=1 Tax=Zostera marina TaxID=29655 RepID=A0A0K9NQV8_ZOSMR|nr:exostosin family protein [Zostera marina]
MRKWPLSFVATFAVILVFMSLFFFFNLPSPLDLYTWSVKKKQDFDTNSTTDQFVFDSFGGVVYRGVPWRSEIGKWLSICGSTSSQLDIVENIYGKDCKNDCSGRGICNQELGQCRCFHGYEGEGCSKKLELGCNLPASRENPYGRWIVSICSAHCDTTRAMCFCGEGTSYPNRPVTESCGFEIIAHKGANFTKADHSNIFTTNASKDGWCNVDPKEAYTKRVNYKRQCDCKYDGFAGIFCEIPTVCTCINQCTGHGHCRGGFCECDRGWFGIDCSIPSWLSSLRQWPDWFQPSTIVFPSNNKQENRSVNFKAMVKKKRPLIYVYDIPPEFNTHLLAGRHFKYECVNRLYSDKNRTIWTNQLYGFQMALLESILASPHRTLNGEEADYFFVPVLDSCIIVRADDTPHFRMDGDHMHLRSMLTLNMYKKVHEHISQQYSFWNRTAGKDHIWSFSWDEGACYAPKEIWNSTMLVHWGNTNSVHKNSTTAYNADNWDRIPSDRRGDHPCFDPSKDLVLPSWKQPDLGVLAQKLWERQRANRKIFFYFNGNLGSAYTNGRVETRYSMGIRQKVAIEFGSTPDKNGKLGRQHSEDVVVTPIRSSNYFNELGNSIFCGVFPGDGWSGRLEDCIMQGSIPVIVQDGIFLPHENVLNYESFAVRIHEHQIPSMIKILRSLDDALVDLKLSNVRAVRTRFHYHDSVLLEAKRQKKLFGKFDDFGVKFSKLEKYDDVFSTFLQALHYKLHNDVWRRDLDDHRRNLGVPKECLKRTKLKVHIQRS